MISYAPFWETLRKKNLSGYHLIFREGFTASTIQRMREGKNISTSSLDTLCSILSCDISDIICYIEDADLDEAKPAPVNSYKLRSDRNTAAESTPYPTKASFFKNSDQKTDSK